MSFLLSLFSKKEVAVAVAPANVSVDDAQAIPKLISFSAKAISGPSQAVQDNSAKPYDTLLKLLLIGESGAGKSALIKRFTSDTFSSNYCSTIGCDFACRTLQFGSGQVVKLQVWDTSGQERFRSITSSYYRGANGVLLVYSQNDPRSFEALPNWVGEIKQYCSAEVSVMVVSQKSDLEPLVPHEKGRKWAEEQGFLFAVASAKLSEGVFDAFSGLAQACSSNLLGRAVSGSDRQVKQTPTASVLRVNLSELENPNAFVATGEPLRCAGCGCFFSVLSQLSQAPNKIQKSKIEMAPPIHAALGQPAPPKKARAWWNCEMCDFANGVDASDEELAEMQVSSTIDFLVRSPLQVAETRQNAAIFVIDTSGSMNSSIAVGKVPTRVVEKRRQEFQGLVPDGFGGGPGGGQFVSRLEMLQSAVENSIRELYAGAQGSAIRVGIVAFSSDVTVFWGGEPMVLAGDLLSDFDSLRKTDRFRVQARSMEAVLHDLYSLKEGGQTALGPAITVAVNNLDFGDQVTLASDGLANVGVGRMDVSELVADAKQVYIEAGESCRLRGVTCNVLALGEESVGLKLVCEVADQSGGFVRRQKSLVEGLISEKVAPIATQALVMALLPRQLRFNGEIDDEQEMRNWLVRDIGVVHRGANATFGFCWRAGETAAAGGRLGFQVQAVWTKSDGSQIVRVASTSLKLQQQEANDEMVSSVEVQRAAQVVERLTKAGHLVQARAELASARKRLGKELFSPFEPLERLLASGNCNVEDDAVIAQVSILKKAVQK